MLLYFINIQQINVRNFFGFDFFITFLFSTFIDIFVFVSILSISKNIDMYRYLSTIFPSLLCSSMDALTIADEMMFGRINYSRLKAVLHHIYVTRSRFENCENFWVVKDLINIFFNVLNFLKMSIKCILFKISDSFTSKISENFI